MATWKSTSLAGGKKSPRASDPCRYSPTSWPPTASPTPSSSRSTARSTSGQGVGQPGGPVTAGGLGDRRGGPPVAGERPHGEAEGADAGVGHAVVDVGLPLATGVDRGREDHVGDDALALAGKLRLQQRLGRAGQDPGHVLGVEQHRPGGVADGRLVLDPARLQPAGHPVVQDQPAALDPQRRGAAAQLGLLPGPLGQGDQPVVADAGQRGRGRPAPPWPGRTTPRSRAAGRAGRAGGARPRPGWPTTGPTSAGAAGRTPAPRPGRAPARGTAARPCSGTG